MGGDVGSIFIDNIDNQVKFVNWANKRGFLVDYTNKLYKLWDIDLAANKSVLSIDDTNLLTKISIWWLTIMSLDADNGIYELGTWLAVWPRGKFSVDSSSSTLSHQTTWFLSRVRASYLWADFTVDDGTDFATCSTIPWQVLMYWKNFSSSNEWWFDISTSHAIQYYKNWSSGDKWGVEATSNIVKVGNYDLSNNSTLFTIDDTDKTIKSAGGIITNYVAKTATYSILRNDYLINCTSGTFTVTLPTAVGFTWQTYVIKNSGAWVITLDTTSSQTIDGVTTQTLAASLSLTVTSTWANWIII